MVTLSIRWLLFRDLLLVDRGEPISPSQKNTSSTTGGIHTKHRFRHPSETTFFLRPYGEYTLYVESQCGTRFVAVQQAQPPNSICFIYNAAYLTFSKVKLVHFPQVCVNDTFNAPQKAAIICKHLPLNAEKSIITWF